MGPGVLQVIFSHIVTPATHGEWVLAAVTDSRGPRLELFLSAMGRDLDKGNACSSLQSSLFYLYLSPLIPVVLPHSCLSFSLSCSLHNMSSMPSFTSFNPASLEAEPEVIEKPTPSTSESETSNASGSFSGSDQNNATMSTQEPTEQYSDAVPEPVAQPAQAPVAAPTQTVDPVQSLHQTEDVITTAQAPGSAPDLKNPPKSIAIPAPNKRPPPPLKVLRQWLPIYLSQGDAVINRLTAILSTPQGIDEVLMLLGYSSLLGSAVLTQVTKAQLYMSVLRLLRFAKEMPEGSTVMISAEGLPAPRSLRAARSLEALSALIGDFRIFMRLWGLLGMYQWGKAAYMQPSKDTLTRRVTYIQVVVNTVYQVLENGAYLSSKGVMEWSAEKQNKAWLWSSRMWAAHVALEFVKLGHGMLKVKKEAKGNIKDSLVNTGTGYDQMKVEKLAEDVVEEGKLVKDAAVKKAREDKAWTDGFMKNCAYAPLTLHWSVEGGLVTPFVVGALGTIVGLVNVRNQWRATA